ncbi:MAG: ParB N-terminal domain-containing protein [Burkholderiales bacterium]|nr:ParB N-terminal domain-containing protein [Burkholderiales bacterium]
MAELEEGVKAAGRITQPIQVRPHPTQEGVWEIIAGERRWRAARKVLVLICARLSIWKTPMVSALHTSRRFTWSLTAGRCLAATSLGANCFLWLQ